MRCCGQPRYAAMENSENAELLSRVGQILDLAKKHGADSADAIIAESEATSSTVRLGELEDVERSESRDLGLRVFVGKSQSIVSTSALSDQALDDIAKQAIEMARVAPEDPNAGLAEDATSAPGLNDLDLFDDYAPTSANLKQQALEAEDAARAVNGVSNSIGATAGHRTSGIVLANSNGFCGYYRRSSHSVSCAVLAGEGLEMESDYDFSSKVHHADLESPAKIGKTAGERAVRRLGGKKMPTQQVPVVYDPRVTSQLVGNFASAISGTAIARGASFLKDKLGEPVFSGRISILDDPTMKRGLRSRPFDAEGLSAGALKLIENGQLTTWLLDCRTARQLELKSNGRASRGVSGGPSPSSTNLYLAPGEATPEELISDIKQGFYVMGLMGRGGSTITGDYSEGANGFWIENGEITHPVTEVTVASNLAEMFKNLTPANDLEFRGAVNAPTLRVEGMTVGGS